MRSDKPRLRSSFKVKGQIEGQSGKDDLAVFHKRILFSKTIIFMGFDGENNILIIFISLQSDGGKNWQEEMDCAIVTGTILF